MCQAHVALSLSLSIFFFLFHCTANLFIAQIAQLFGRWARASLVSKWLSFVFVSWKAATTAPTTPTPTLPLPYASTSPISQVKPQLTAAATAKATHKNELQKRLCWAHFSAFVQISRLANLFMAWRCSLSNWILNLWSFFVSFPCALTNLDSAKDKLNDLRL